ncbi:MAG: carbon storage regulator [Planctomyces sp.]|nr:carbon storage regulator [Planctomyces sp.]MBA4039887.1 carbon storage regulator [Planctomyces sp.]MBA4120786.1 carbon storage regulator [Isosphaera sp.]
MLVLSRLRDETIMIGDEIEITVVDIRGDKVRLGITAPTRIAVHRKEVYEAIRAENQRAARIAGPDLPQGPPGAPPVRSRLPGRAAALHSPAQPLPLAPTPITAAPEPASRAARQA